MWGIAWRNFGLQFHRYRVLLAALTLGAVVFTILFGVTTSLTGTVREKAARYFSGDVMVLSFTPKKDWVIADEPAVSRALDALGSEALYRHRRSLYYETDARLIFNGTSLVQRRVIGVDFQVERENFSRLEFVEGGLPAEVPGDGLWVSNDTAERLHIRTGDEVTLRIRTLQGFVNTVPLRLAGIFQDSSFFGFASYLDYRTLNRALGRPENTVTELGASLSAHGNPEEAARRVLRALEDRAPTLPWVGSLEHAYEVTDAARPTKATYAVLPLSGRLKQINDLIQAIYSVNVLLAAVFLVVVAIGVYNTYQMIAYERTKEIGTMRALGMQKPAVVLLFLAESVLLGLLSSVAGLGLGSLGLAVLGQVDFSGNPLAQMFLQHGRVAWAWPWQNVAAVVGVMWLTTIAGALIPAWRAASRRPVDALRQD